MILALALVLQTTSDSSLATRVRQLADSYLTAYFEQHPDEATLDGVRIHARTNAGQFARRAGALAAARG